MKRIIIILPAQHKARAMVEVERITGETECFVATFNDDGDMGKAHSHYACNWALPDDQYTDMLAEFSKRKWGADIGEGMADLSEPTNGKVKGPAFAESKGRRARKDRDR